MIYLDTQTGFSFLSAYGKPEQVVDRAKTIGASHVGIADFCSTWGHIPFWKAAKGIKPLFGVKIPVWDGSDKEPRYSTVTLIAKDNIGLRNQYEALSLATSQFYYRPRLTWKQISKVSRNYIIINDIGQIDINRIKPSGTVYLGATPRPGPLLKACLEGRFNVAISIAPAYPEPGDLESYKLVNAISRRRKVQDIAPYDMYMMRETEIIDRFKTVGVKEDLIRKWISDGNAIARSCKAAPSQGKNIKPDIDITIEEWCENGAKHRGIDLTSEPYKSRYEREIAMVHEKGFTDYFLLIADLVEWAKERMFVGPARGSSAGSLVCYLMGIVEVDPMAYGLLFERFIDINREDLPDVDIDFPDDKRDQVFEYIANKYGREYVARIGTLSLFRPKSALNDVAKCYAIPKWEVDKLTEVMIDRSGGDARASMAIEDTIQQFDVGQELVKKHPRILMAAKIEGHPRHTGKHAAGVIVSDEPIANFAAVNRRDGQDTAMINKNDAESIGLLKIDALGLKTLSVLEDCCNQIDMDPRDLYTLPTDKQEAFRLFQEDRVAGIFQFEGYAVRSLMRQMGVEDFNDIVALTALARPGPLHCGAANEFIARRTESKDWEYFIPEIKLHTSHTYGTIVYQEQVMSITRDLGDMSWQDVSALRKAMSKSLGEEFFNQFRDKFLIGTNKRGIDEEKALNLWNDMCTFGSWAFNLSHAVSYALISYWCAYLKANHPAEFAVAQLRKTFSEDHVLRLLRELIKEDVEVIPFDPDISNKSWKIHKGKIYGGFLAVKGVGEVTADRLIAKRDAGGKKWIKDLTPVQRTKLLAPNNTPWHNLDRLQKKYAEIYETKAISMWSELHEKNITHTMEELCLVEDITEVAGKYIFLATIKQRNLRDLNETQSLAKRGGRRETKNELFLNLVVEDDTASILCTIDRWQYPMIGKPLMEEEADGVDFLISGSIRQDGWRKIYINKIFRLDQINGQDDTAAGNEGDPGRGEDVEAAGGTA